MGKRKGSRETLRNTIGIIVILIVAVVAAYYTYFRYNTYGIIVKKTSTGIVLSVSYKAGVGKVFIPYMELYSAKIVYRGKTISPTQLMAGDWIYIKRKMWGRDKGKIVYVKVVKGSRARGQGP